MKKTKSMRLAVLAAGLLCCSIFTVPAYAQSSEPQEETPPAQEAPAETEAQPETQNPFSTDGTGTVVDNATDEDGKEFYTITTPDENIFYLVIDKQKTTDNVYFLNAVTEADLLPLAEKSEEETAEPAPEPEPEPTVVRLMAAGDVMSHMPITNDAFVAASGTYSFAHMLQDAAEQLSGADYALANLETPLAGGPDYSGYPTFNAPDSLASDLRAAGFDLLSTANNHSLDRGTRGVYRTLDVLDQEGLAHAGTYRSQEERDASSGVYVADVGGVSVAFLSYTYGLNGFRLPQGEEYAVNLFSLDYYTTLSDPDYDRLQADLEAARAVPAPEAEEGSLLAAVNLLPPKYRAVIYLYYYEGYSANEIAQLLGEKPATVATQLSRGREKLRTHLEQEGFA